MVYASTQQVVERVRPLLEQMASRTIDKARLLQYLSAMAGVRWGMFTLVSREQSDAREIVTVHDNTSEAEFQFVYPDCLPRAWETLVIAEYLRLATDKPLTKMDLRLFDHFYGGGYCAGCQWHREQQICGECHFAGYPVNFEPFDPAAAPPLSEETARE